MTNFLGIEIEQEEIDYILASLKTNENIDMDETQLMDNICQSGEVKNSWEIRVSKVSLKDLPHYLSEHDYPKFTDGDHNGRIITIPFFEKYGQRSRGLLIEDYIDSRLKELEKTLLNSVLMSNMDLNTINYLRGKVDMMDDLIYNSEYDISSDLDSFGSRISELKSLILQSGKPCVTMLKNK